MEDSAEVRIGRSNVKFNGIDLGFTEGDIVVTYTPEHRDFRPDQSTTKLRKFLINEDAKITVPLVQTLAKSLTRGKAFPLGELKAAPIGGGGVGALINAVVVGAVTIDLDAGEAANFDINDWILLGSGPTAELVQMVSKAVDVITLQAATPIQFAHAIGEPAIESDITKVRIAIGNPVASEAPTGVLDIIPLDGSDPVRFFKAQVADEIEITFQKGEETIVEIPFEALEDTSRARGDRLFSLGDQSVA